ncbi:MAG: hypothetical protein JO277_08885 [Candidatus Eremiobacteraeota bacterium]|nr:hypothetical protein [Candidatus Eremiobacteraeota bacterium]
MKADGLIGPHTVAATNRALATYAPGFTSGGFTKAQIVRLASQIAAYLEKAPYSTPAAAAAAAPVLAPPPAMIPSQQASAPDTAPAPEGSAMPPYSQPGYYPPNYYPPRGPGGLPTNRATVDVKAFIPAQYEHVQINPGTAMLVIGLGVAVTLLLTKEKRAKKAA